MCYHYIQLSPTIFLVMSCETCSFCLDDSSPTIIACGCTGGVQHVHTTCLRKWMLQGATRCSACRQEYVNQLGLVDRWKQQAKQQLTTAASLLFGLVVTYVIMYAILAFMVFHFILFFEFFCFYDKMLSGGECSRFYATMYTVCFIGGAGCIFINIMT